MFIGERAGNGGGVRKLGMTGIIQPAMILFQSTNSPAPETATGSAPTRLVEATFGGYASDVVRMVSETTPMVVRETTTTMAISETTQEKTPVSLRLGEPSSPIAPATAHLAVCFFIYLYDITVW